MAKVSVDVNWKILTTLEEISYKLDRLIDLKQISLKEQTTLLKSKTLGKSDLRKQVYDLCDGNRSVGQLAEVLAKSIVRVSQELAILEEAGLVKSKKIGKEKYYEKLV